MTRSDVPHVPALILAAGSSTRLGHAKQLLDWHGISLVRHVAQIALASAASDSVVVIGHSATEVEAALDGMPVHIILNPDFADGQSTSFRAGLGALPPHTAAVVVLLGDQPGIEPETIDALITVWQQTGAPIVRARYQGHPSHPILFDARLLSDLIAVSGDAGARTVLRDHETETVYADLDQPLPPDIDTEADYQQALLDER